MEILITIKTRSTSAFAEAIYNGETTLVKAGGRVSLTFADHIQGGRKAKQYRNNPEYVDGDGNIIEDCLFSSPSTAAQFVTGRSTNGYQAWKVDHKKSLGDFLSENGLR